jgi:hypothetical protein
MTRPPRLEHQRATSSFSGIVATITTTTTNAGADALLTYGGLEALLVPSDGRPDINGDRINGLQ